MISLALVSPATEAAMTNAAAPTQTLSYNL